MIVEEVRRFIDENGIPSCGIVAAVSGGPDSVALLLALAELRSDGFAIVCGHVNHHLRGADSDDDEAFVRDLCRSLGIELHASDGTLEPAAVKARGVEAAAREIRTRRLLEIRNRTGASYIATAHQKNDQAETVLMRLFRGSGLAGLRGIHPIRADGFIRPLLTCSRAEIERFLHDRDIAARHDVSNDDPRFFRNQIRRVLRQFDESVIDNIAAIARQAGDQWQVIEALLDRVPVDATADATRFSAWPEPSWLRQALLHRHILRLDPEAREVSADDLARIESQLDAIKRTSITKNLELIRKNRDLVLRKRIEPIPEFEYDIKPGESRYLPEIQATVTLSQAVTRHSSPVTQLFQLREPHAVFTLRNRRDGDRFQPLGMARDKKLKDFLIDRKIPVEVRDSLPLLVWDNQIVWVGGVEVSERFKVTDPATELYEVRLERDGTSTAGEESIQR